MDRPTKVLYAAGAVLTAYGVSSTLLSLFDIAVESGFMVPVNGGPILAALIAIAIRNLRPRLAAWLLILAVVGSMFAVIADNLRTDGWALGGPGFGLQVAAWLIGPIAATAWLISGKAAAILMTVIVTAVVGLCVVFPHGLWLQAALVVAWLIGGGVAARHWLTGLEEAQASPPDPGLVQVKGVILVDAQEREDEFRFTIVLGSGDRFQGRMNKSLGPQPLRDDQVQFNAVSHSEKKVNHKWPVVASEKTSTIIKS